MTETVRSGKVHAWGTSEWSAQQITEACWIAKCYGLEPPMMEQPQYHMFHRDRVEQEYHPMYAQPYNMGTTIWAPLASGILTNKYANGIPDDSRAAQKGYSSIEPMVARWKENGNLLRVQEIDSYARSTFGDQFSSVQLAIAWCIKNPNVSTVLVGATKTSQLEANIKALELVPLINETHMEEIDEILRNKPTSYMGWGGSGVREKGTLI
eukprot:scaffold137_cov398-Prasinococcus_capsulatus_cf.AAC.12